MKPKINTNYVAIRPLELDSSLDLVMDSVFDPYKNSSIKGEVVMVCDKLYYDNVDSASEFIPASRMTQIQMINEYSLARRTEIEIEVGDHVIFSYTAHMSCVEDNSYYLDDQDRQVYLLPYDQLSFNLTTLNPISGYIFVEPIEVNSQYITRDGINIYYDQDHLPGIGRVKYGPNPGKLVAFHALQVAPEYKYHQTMNPEGLPLIRIPITEIIEIV